MMEMDKNEEDYSPSRGNPFKVVDYNRENRFGIVAKDLTDLIQRACEKLGISNETPVKVVLEQDGTEVDDEDYFSTLEKNTSLMILKDGEKWLLTGKLPRYRIIVDEPDGDGGAVPRKLEGLVDRLHTDLASITMLGGKELELLADMDPDSLADMLPDKVFLESLKEASCRFLTEKREAQDAIDLLKLYHCHQLSSDHGEKTTV